jgi:hypothetical protein
METESFSETLVNIRPSLILDIPEENNLQGYGSENLIFQTV